MTDPFERSAGRREVNASRWVFWLLAVALLPLMLRASLDFGATWDELARHRNGENVLEYLRGERSGEAASGGRTIYPALFDVICAWLEQQVSADRYVLRHLVNASFGWVGILFCGRLAARLFGTWTGVLTLILLAASPRYFGHSMNNPKDLPFAAMSVVALYYFSTISPRWPYLSVGVGAKIAAALALGLSTRPAALLYMGYLPVLLGALAVAGRTVALGPVIVVDRDVDWRKVADTSLRVAIVSIAVLLLGTVFWPWAREAPFTRPFSALSDATEYGWNGMVLFNGAEYPATELPSSYLPVWFLISTPPVVLAGMVLSPFARGGRAQVLSRLALWAAAVGPIALVILRDSTVYDGMRHVLFVYPAMVAVAASGWSGVATHTRPWIRRGALALLSIGLLHVLAANLRLYPNQVAYVNELGGGPRGAFGRFELDYWGNCLLQAVAWSADTAERAQMPVIVWGDPSHLTRANAARFPQIVMAESAQDPHHLVLELGRGPMEEVTALAARPDALHHVRAPDGAVLCTVLPGPEFDQLHRRLLATELRSPGE